MKQIFLDAIFAKIDPILEKYGLNKTYLLGLVMIITGVLQNYGYLPDSVVEVLKKAFVVDGVEVAPGPVGLITAGVTVIFLRSAITKTQKSQSS